MVFPAVLLLVAALLGPLSVEARSVSVSSATPFQAPSAIKTTSNVLTLTKNPSTKGYNPRSAAYLLGLTPSSKIATSNHTSTLLSVFEGQEFLTPITFGTETFEVIVDTGSSDTWVVETGFKCANLSNSDPLPEADCGFGTTYNVTDTFKQIPNENFNITYADGEFLTGIVGTEEVTLAGIKVNTTVAVVSFAAWEGSGVETGLTGLAYPAITNVYAGTNPKVDNTPAGEQVVYNPIFTTMVKDGLVAPLFSLVILRDISGDAGYLSLGGVPPIPFTQNFTSTPILITTITGYPKTYDFYTIHIHSVVLNGATVHDSGGSSRQYIVDSGTTLNYLPTSVADAVNAAFVPPAVYSDDEGAYIVSCNATAPRVAIEIEGVQFGINPLDLILLAGTDADGNNVCISGIDDGGSNSTEDVYVLGDTFQKNVVSVFDVGAGEMRFAGREYYPSNDPVRV